MKQEVQQLPGLTQTMSQLNPQHQDHLGHLGHQGHHVPPQEPPADQVAVAVQTTLMMKLIKGIYLLF